MCMCAYCRECVALNAGYVQVAGKNNIIILILLLPFKILILQPLNQHLMAGVKRMLERVAG